MLRGTSLVCSRYTFVQALAIAAAEGLAVAASMIVVAAVGAAGLAEGPAEGLAEAAGLVAGVEGHIVPEASEVVGHTAAVIQVVGS